MRAREAADRVFTSAVPSPEATTTNRAGEPAAAAVPTAGGNGTVSIEAPANATTSDTDQSRAISQASGPSAASGPASGPEAGVGAAASGGSAGTLAATAALGALVLFAAALLV